MPIRTEKIWFNGNNANIKLNLGSNDNFIGYQQEIDNLTQNTSDELINPAVDVEERRFKSQYVSPYSSMKFNMTTNGVTYTTSFLSAGFTASELANGGSSVLNSFFIFDYYNTYDTTTQIKIFTNYLTKIGNSNAEYTINSSNQVYYMYVPLSYINENIASGNTIVTGYTKISFYNAKTGKVALFQNSAIVGSAANTPQIMFFPTQLNLVNKTWGFTSNSITGKQIWTSTEYINKVNSTITNFNNEVQNYPNGTAFDFESGRYV